MPEYIKDILSRFQYPNPKSPQYSPHKHILTKHGLKTRKYAIQPDNSPLLDKNGIKYVQQGT